MKKKFSKTKKLGARKAEITTMVLCKCPKCKTKYYRSPENVGLAETCGVCTEIVVLVTIKK